MCLPLELHHISFDRLMHQRPHPPGIGLTQPASDRLTLEGSNLTVTGFIYQRAGLGGIGGDGGIEPVTAASHALKGAA